MSRRPRKCDLPEIRQITPLGESPALINQTAHVETQLRQIATRFRGQKKLRFYTMDEIASRFQLSKASVYRVYKTLQNEGFLKVQRGSQTWLLPEQSERKASLRGILALAVWFPGLAQFPDWRLFLRQFELSAWKHRIACYPILYEHLEDGGQAFYKRIRQYQPDWFAWLYPLAVSRDALLQLNDAGISPIIVTKSKSILPQLSPYFLDFEKPAIAVLKKWKNQGVQVAHVYADSTDARIEQAEWKRWVHESGLDFRYTDLKSGILPEAPSGNATEGIIFYESFGTSLLLQKWKHHPEYWESQHFLVSIRTDMREVAVVRKSAHLYGILPDWAKAADTILDAITGPERKQPGHPIPLPMKTFHSNSLADFDFSNSISTHERP